VETYRPVIDDYLGLTMELHSLGGGEPRVLITAGVHGGEATGIFAARKVLEELQAVEEQLSGTITISPVCNVAAFRRMTRKSPFDELDLNRIFPGEDAGSPSQRTAALLWKYALEADYIIDLHCCGPHCASYVLGLHREHDFVHDFAAMFDLPIVVQSGGAAGQLFVESNRLDKPAVILELTGGGRVGEINLEEGMRAASAVLGVLRQLGIAPGRPGNATPRFCGPLQGVQSPGAGLYLPKVAAGDPIEEGQELGVVEGDPILSPVTGVAVRVRPPSYIFGGSPVTVAAFEVSV